LELDHTGENFALCHPTNFRTFIRLWTDFATFAPMPILMVPSPMNGPNRYSKQKPVNVCKQQIEVSMENFIQFIFAIVAIGSLRNSRFHVCGMCEL
jgi:hypothetical protein